MPLTLFDDNGGTVEFLNKYLLIRARHAFRDASAHPLALFFLHAICEFLVSILRFIWLLLTRFRKFEFSEVRPFLSEQAKFK